MNCEDTIDMILTFGRVTILILGVLASVFLIYLGWKLYRDRIKSHTEASFSSKDLKVTLSSIGPGIFLALFGAYLLVSITNNKLGLTSATTRAISEKQPEQSAQVPTTSITRTLYSGPDGHEPATIDKSLALAIQALESARSSTQDSARLTEIRVALSTIEDLRTGLSK